MNSSTHLAWAPAVLAPPHGDEGGEAAPGGGREAALAEDSRRGGVRGPGRRRRLETAEEGVRRCGRGR